jgi:broad specificity phosphatase PhoE
MPRSLICLVRHGETDWNRDGRLQGMQDTPLNPRGRDQAAAAGRLLATVHPEVAGFAFVASPLKRTRTTMELMRSAMGLAPTDYRLDDRLKELTFGRWEGMTLAELALHEPVGAKAREADKWGFVPPGGESYAMLSRRVAGWLDELEGPTVAVSHGGVARVLLGLVGGVGKLDLPTLEITQGRVLVFEAERYRWV